MHYCIVLTHASTILSLSLYVSISVEYKRNQQRVVRDVGKRMIFLIFAGVIVHGCEVKLLKHMVISSNPTTVVLCSWARCLNLLALVYLTEYEAGFTLTSVEKLTLWSTAIQQF